MVIVTHGVRMFKCPSIVQCLGLNVKTAGLAAIIEFFNSRKIYLVCSNRSKGILQQIGREPGLTFCCSANTESMKMTAGRRKTNTGLGAGSKLSCRPE